MTDEKLEKILKEALTSDIKDEEIIVQQKVRKYPMKKIIAISMVTAACAALVVTANLQTTQTHNPLKPVKIVTTINNSFALKANAAEITKDKKVPTNLGGTANIHYAFMLIEAPDAFAGHAYVNPKEDGYSCSVGHDDSYNQTRNTYFLGTGFTCEGNNIDKITYQINKGAFLINEKKGTSIIKDYEKYTGNDLSIVDTATCQTPQREQTNSTNTQVQATSYTVDYQQQTSKNTNISICESIMDEKAFQSIFDEDISIQKRVKAANQLMKDFEITCTVTYKDGSTETKAIGIEGYKDKDESAGFAFVLK